MDSSPSNIPQEFNSKIVKADEEGRTKSKLCAIEEKDPEKDWQHSFYLSRLKGMSPEVKSFNFKLLHNILPTKSRVSRILPNTSPLCTLCTSLEVETSSHALFTCNRNSEAADFVLHLVRICDNSITKEKLIQFQVFTDAIYELPTILVASHGLSLIWKNRLIKKSTRPFEIRAELECLIVTLRKSRRKTFKEAGDIIENNIKNFPFL